MHSSDSMGCNVSVAMRLLWDCSKRSQLLYRDSWKSGRSLLNEMCTISVGTSRGCGHDTAIMEMLNEFESSAIVFPVAAMRTHAKIKLQENEKYKNGDIDLFLADNLDFLRGKSYDAVFVNCHSLLSENKLNQIKDICASYAFSKIFGLFLVQ